MQVLPERTADLIVMLDRLVPSLRIKPKTTIEEIMFNAGQREFAENLKVWWNYTISQQDAYKNLTEVK